MASELYVLSGDLYKSIKHPFFTIFDYKSASKDDPAVLEYVQDELIVDLTCHLHKYNYFRMLQLNHSKISDAIAMVSHSVAWPVIILELPLFQTRIHIRPGISGVCQFLIKTQPAKATNNKSLPVSKMSNSN